jgi:glycine cleavage system H protein
MANIPNDLKYTQDHEWARISGKNVTVGITEHASNTLGDIVYVELPKVGQKLSKGDPFGTVESVKAVSELFAPVSGTVTKVNSDITDEPELLNTEPYHDGWIIELEASDTKQFSELLDAAAYGKLLASEQ